MNFGGSWQRQTTVVSVWPTILSRPQAGQRHSRRMSGETWRPGPRIVTPKKDEVIPNWRMPLFVVGGPIRKGSGL
jgi:hypothetical protein